MSKSRNDYDHRSKVFICDISPTEEMVMNDKALPKELRGWRCYRFEYGGCNEDELYEGRLLLPPQMDPQAVADLIMGADAHRQIWRQL